MLKIFVPDRMDKYDKQDCPLILKPLFQKHLSPEIFTQKFGAWQSEIQLAEDLTDCDIAVLMYDISYYYRHRQHEKLEQINRQTLAAGKLLICFTKGDSGITPRLRQFQLYRWGGYASKNEGNQFALPVIIEDPLAEFFNGEMQLHNVKTEKAVIGFCGHGSGGAAKYIKEIFINLNNRLQKLLKRRYEDNEKLISSTYMRSKLLDRLEASGLVETRFIRHTKYRGGVVSSEEKKKGRQVFYNNIIETQYTLCYRGAGNFSVRLFETMACARIPILVMSDNNLPLPDKIDWSRFPAIHENEPGKIDSIIAAFHASLSNEQFVQLQLYAREMWETYLTYSGFFKTSFLKYAQHKK